jgi:hypothetical protein
VDTQADRMPAGAAEAVRRIGAVLDDILGHPTQLAADPDALHNVIRLARTDLPLSVQTYLNLPRWLTIGRRAADELLTQLSLLDTDAQALADRFYATDLRRQSDHTRYLRERTRDPDAPPD